MKIVKSGVFLFAFFLPINTGVSNFFLASTLIASIYVHFNVGFPENKCWRILFFSTVPLFLLHILGLFYTNYPEDGYHYIEKTISYLLTPIIFIFFSYKNLIEIRAKFLLGLLYGSVFSILILTTINLYNYFGEQDAFYVGFDVLDYYHTYIHFTAPLNQHPTYLGSYFLTVLIFINGLIKKSNLKYFFIVVLGLGFLFLNARIIFLALTCLAAIRIYQKVKKLILQREYKNLLFLAIFCTAALLIVTNIISKSYIGNRLTNIVRFELSTKSTEKVNSRISSNPRVSRYISAMELVKERPLFGYGVADEYPNLKKQFKRDNLILAAEKNYNSHNQFIGYAIRFGLFGVMVLLFFFLSNIAIGIQAKEYDYALTFFLLSFICLTENYMDRNYGITFIAVLSTVFSYQIRIKLRYQKKDSLPLP